MGKHTLMESFLFFKPFSRLPLGSFESDVKGFLFLRGLLARKREKAVLAAVHANSSMMLAAQQRDMAEKEKGRVVGTMLVLGRL